MTNNPRTIWLSASDNYLTAVDNHLAAISTPASVATFALLETAKQAMEDARVSYDMAAQSTAITLRDAIRARLYDWDNKKQHAPSVQQLEAALAALGYPGCEPHDDDGETIKQCL